MSIKYSDSGFLDGADETKKLSFDVSGVTTGTTRTITMPDANVDLSSVGTPDDNSVTLAKMASGTDGNLITYDASGDPAYVTTGTSGQVLTSGGTGVAPTFQAAAGGGVDGITSSATGTAIYINSSDRVHIGASTTGNFQFYVEAHTLSESMVGINNTENSGQTRTSVSLMRFGTEVGKITTSNTATAYNTSSDYRLKENVVPMTGSINRLKTLKPSRFNFIVDADTTVDGFLAHEAQEVVPEAITGTKDELDDNGDAIMQGIDQAKLVPLLVSALQEAIARIEELTTRIEVLEGIN